MTIFTVSAFLSDDLARGEVSRVFAVRTLDGVAGWAICAMADGSTWAYAPQHLALLTGEIAREIA